MTESKKVNKGIRVSEDAWHMAKSEAESRCIYLGDFVEAMIRWTLTAHTMTCPNCQKDFELNVLNYIELEEEK